MTGPAGRLSRFFLSRLELLMDVRLFVTNGKTSARQLRLQPETLIGRSPECNPRIASAEVSRKHGLITISGDVVRVRDLGSANGTELDGAPIPAEVDIAVSSGSTLIVGPLKFVLRFVAQPEAAKEPKDDDPQSTTHDILPPLLAPLTDDGDTKDYLPSRIKRDSSGASDEPDSAQIDFLEGEPESPAAIVNDGVSEPPIDGDDDALFASVSPDGIEHLLECDEASVIELQPVENSSIESAAVKGLSKTPRSGWKFLDFLRRDDSAEVAEPRKKQNLPKRTRPPATKPPAAKPPTAKRKPVKPTTKVTPAKTEDDDALFDFFRKNNP